MQHGESQTDKTTVNQKKFTQLTEKPLTVNHDKVQTLYIQTFYGIHTGWLTKDAPESDVQDALNEGSQQEDDYDLVARQWMLYWEPSVDVEHTRWDGSPYPTKHC